jgi:hypothetical protein
MALFNEIFNTFRWKCMKCGIKYFYNKGIYKDSQLEVHCPICTSIEKEPYFDEYIHKFICGSTIIKPENFEGVKCPDHGNDCKRISFERRGQKNEGRIPIISKIFTNTSIISIITIMSRETKWWSRKELKEYHVGENQSGGIILELTKEAITQYIDFLAGIGILDELSSIVKRTSKILGIDRYSDFNDYYYRYNNRNHYDIDNLENQIAEEICEYFKKTNKEWISKKDLIKSIFTDKDNNNLVTIASEKLKDYSDKATRMEFKENISYLISKDIIESRTFRDLIEKESGYKIQGQLHNEKYYIYNAKEFNKIRGELVDFAKKMNSENHRTKTKEKMIEEAQLDLFLRNTQNLANSCEACIIPAGGIGLTFYLSKNRSIIIGRNKDADIFVGDLNISRTNNAEIIHKKGEYYIFNNGNSTQIKLNDIIIEDQTILKNGNKITIGNETFYFVDNNKIQIS